MGETRTRSLVITNQMYDFNGTKETLYPGSCTSSPPFYSGGPWTQNALMLHESKIMTDVVTPRYKELSAKGMIINNPLTRVHTYERYDPIPWEMWAVAEKFGCNPVKWYEWLRTSQSGVRRIDTLDPSAPVVELTPPAVEEQSLIDRAVSQAYANIDTSEIFILATLAEGEKSIMSLVTIFKRLNRILKKLRKKQFRALRNEIQPAELANWYMEARYALRPLYYDCLGVLAALQKDLKGKRQTFRGHCKDESSVENSIEVQRAVQTWAVCKFMIDMQASTTVNVRAGVLCDIEDMSLITPFGPTRIAETAWELVPFSFIVDWFFNVSDVIGSWSPNMGINELASWYVVERTTFQSSIIRDYWLQLGATTSSTRYTGDFASARFLGMQRIVKTVTRVPNPNKPVWPRFRLKLDAAKLLDLAIIGKGLWFGGRNSLRLGSLRF